MKALTTLFAAIALLSPLALNAADFEGTIAMNMTGPRDRTMPVTFSIKHGFTRTDMQAEGQTVSMIMNQEKREVVTLMPQQKMYMVHSLDDQAMAAAQEKMGDVQVEKTNEHATIAGYETTKYIAKSKEGTTEAWVSDQLGTFLGMGNGQAAGPGGRRGNRASQAWEEVFKGKNQFPLRVVTTSNAGKQTFKMEATAVDKKSLPDSLFQPPADFQKFDLGAMMRGMGMPGMPGGARPPRGGDKED